MKAETNKKAAIEQGTGDKPRVVLKNKRICKAQIVFGRYLVVHHAVSWVAFLPPYDELQSINVRRQFDRLAVLDESHFPHQIFAAPFHRLFVAESFSVLDRVVLQEKVPAGGEEVGRALESRNTLATKYT